MKRIAIIGGGASGMMAACQAASQGARVVLFERQKCLGRKVLATGNGRCNIANSAADTSHYHGRNPHWVKSVFARFGLEDTIRFFESVGIPLVEEERGRLFPASLHAATVTSVFQYELARRGVDVRLHRLAEDVRPHGKKIRIVTAGREEDLFDAVIIAAGSCAAPQLGASRAGYDITASLGHRVHEPFPAILPIAIPMKALHRLEGLKRDCGVRVMVGGKERGRSDGELLFTKYGISGPAALDVSRAVNGAVLDGKEVELRIDLFPLMDPGELGQMLDTLWSDGEKTLAFSLLGIMRERMAEVLLSIMDISPDLPVKKLTPQERRMIASCMKGLAVRPGQPRSFNEAVVAAGGVEVDEVDPATMESRIVKNVYLTGELLDIDGDSGGYNLQFAWSTGAIAGVAAASHS